MKKIFKNGQVYWKTIMVYHDGLVAHMKEVSGPLSYLGGDAHRDGAPATIWPDGWVEWFIDGDKFKSVDTTGFNHIRAAVSEWNLPRREL